MCCMSCVVCQEPRDRHSHLQTREETFRCVVCHVLYVRMCQIEGGGDVFSIPNHGEIEVYSRSA